ncbi:MAG TPA: response regulator transcription factor [Bacillota bacterium]|jgi:two-component system response regulator VicR|nr:response regulator transcription factor [Bacillota bacterium]HOA36252.1 response regulator transcription factor [Bacillota bacterium]HOJ84070.1 response regulator transcription factor [Bacillota bacterium]HOL15368.1 response regulator transcription factor [Bacillota bacterium]HPZ12291.1 response regulator transcription factor [Bacillota bacterium]
MSAKKKVLLVDDEKTLVKALKFNLEKEGFLVEEAYNGEEALEKAFKVNPDIIILDLMLPGLDGFEVCREIRKKEEIPIIMLTAKGEDIDKVLGLELGADDYITKPFNPRELVARMKAILRRSAARDDGLRKQIQIGALQIDLLQHRVRLGEREIDLTAKEFALLSFLASNAGRVYSREQLLEQIWGYDYYGDARTVDVHIRHLREKIEEDPSKPQLILTVWGTGYKFREEA